MNIPNIDMVALRLRQIFNPAPGVHSSQWHAADALYYLTGDEAFATAADELAATPAAPMAASAPSVVGTAAHTPGPWLINTAGGAKAGQPFQITEFFVYTPNTQDDTAICADVIDPVTQEPSEANARLIAAAPELLAACQLALFAFETNAAIDWRVLDAAIAKATAAPTNTDAIIAAIHREETPGILADLNERLERAK